MIVTTKKAETKLLQELLKCRRESPGQKCFHIEFSGSEISERAFFENILRLIRDIPGSYMAQIYICQDRDVFILMQGFMAHQFLNMLRSLAQALDDETVLDRANIYEIGTHWNRLEPVCRAKIEAVDKKREQEIEKRRQKEARKIMLEVFSQMECPKLASIASRRANREEVVVMVVDDDQIARTLLGNIVDKKFRYAYAKNGRDALETYVECAPDILFLDIGLPDINGHEILESLSAVDPENYIIMFSGRKDKENMMRSLDLGAQGFVGKPFTPDKIVHFIDRSPYVQNKISTSKPKTTKENINEREAG